MTRPNIEHLRDKLTLLKDDAQFLYRYGDIGASLDFFRTLDSADQRRFLCMAFLHGDKDMQKVAEALAIKTSDFLWDSVQLIAELPPEDRAEIDACYECSPSSDPIDCESRIRWELRQATRTLGQLDFEEAVWILVPDSLDTPATWIEAVGEEGKPFSLRLRLPSSIIYDPGKDKEHALLVKMRKAACILHVHNHPEPSGTIRHDWASSQDLAFAAHWKSLRPEIKTKMRFFVVAGKDVAEYTEASPCILQWCF